MVADDGSQTLPLPHRLGLAQEQIVSYCNRPLQQLPELAKQLQISAQNTRSQRRLMASQDDDEPSPKRAKTEGLPRVGPPGQGSFPGGSLQQQQQQPMARPPAQMVRTASHQRQAGKVATGGQVSQRDPPSGFSMRHSLIY